MNNVSFHNNDIEDSCSTSKEKKCEDNEEPLKEELEVVPKKISDYQVSEKIHSKAGAEENIIMEIPLWPSAAENV